MDIFLVILLFITCFLFVIYTILSIFFHALDELNTNFIYRYNLDNDDSN